MLGGPWLLLRFDAAPRKGKELYEPYAYAMTLPTPPSPTVEEIRAAFEKTKWSQFPASISVTNTGVDAAFIANLPVYIPALMKLANALVNALQNAMNGGACDCLDRKEQLKGERCWFCQAQMAIELAGMKVISNRTTLPDGSRWQDLQTPEDSVHWIIRDGNVRVVLENGQEVGSSFDSIYEFVSEVESGRLVPYERRGCPVSGWAECPNVTGWWWMKQVNCRSVPIEFYENDPNFIFLYGSRRPISEFVGAAFHGPLKPVDTGGTK